MFWGRVDLCFSPSIRMLELSFWGEKMRLWLCSDTSMSVCDVDRVLCSVWTPAQSFWSVLPEASCLHGLSSFSDVPMVVHLSGWLCGCGSAPSTRSAPQESKYYPVLCLWLLGPSSCITLGRFLSGNRIFLSFSLRRPYEGLAISWKLVSLWEVGIFSASQRLVMLSSCWSAVWKLWREHVSSGPDAAVLQG